MNRKTMCPDEIEDLEYLDRIHESARPENPAHYFLWELPNGDSYVGTVAELRSKYGPVAAHVVMDCG